MLKGYRTIIFNALAGLVLLYRVAFPSADVPGTEELGGIVDQLVEHLDAVILIGGNVALRFLTKTSVFKKA